MALRSFYLKTFLLAISLLSTTVTAQDSPNNTNLSGCSEQSLQKDWPVNATGSANVSNIYLSTTFGDYRNDTNNDSTSRRFRPITMAYLTVPLESHGKACVYLYQGVDNRGRGGGPNGCDDVLAQACVDVLERKLRLPDDMPPAGMVCPSGAHDDELDKACGDDTVLRGVFSSASTIDLGNSSQSCSNIPKGIDLNSGDYTTREIFGWGPQDYDTDPQNFTWYDEYVTRPVPMVLSTNIDGKAEAKVVCIAMNRLNNDSRVPPDSINNGKDNESAAVSMQWKSKAGMAILMVGVPIISFVLA